MNPKHHQLRVLDQQFLKDLKNLAKRMFVLQKGICEKIYT